MAKRVRTGRPTRPGRRSPADMATLAIDVGGSGLKATVLDGEGSMIGDGVRVDTPYPAPPDVIVGALVDLVDPLSGYGRVSIGFPGVVRDQRVITAPHFGNERWENFPLGDAMAKRLGKPVRVLNDADIQGYGAIRGKGLEFVITLGTGLGTALFRDGRLMPHMEFAQFPVRKKKTFNDYVGNVARKEISEKKWNHRVAKTIDAFRTLLNFDLLYIGGGNARKLTISLPRDVKIVSNKAGLTGGIRLWDVESAGGG